VFHLGLTRVITITNFGSSAGANQAKLPLVVQGQFSVLYCHLYGITEVQVFQATVYHSTLQVLATHFSTDSTKESIINFEVDSFITL
jgi:hypothetical protein